MTNEIDHPEHYNQHPSGVECIDIAEHYDFCIGNVIKYVWRAGLKSHHGYTSEESRLQDLKKARWYLDREIVEIEREMNAPK